MGLPGTRLRGVVVEIDLAPPVSLDPVSQRSYQRAVEDGGVEINFVQRSTEQIELGRRHPNSRELLRVCAESQKLTITQAFPRAALDVLVMEADEIVKAALAVLKPGIVPSVRVCVRKQIPAPGQDARVFLGDRVLQLSGERKAAFGRPIHMVGVKFFMPPFEVVRDEQVVAQHAEDSVEVRIESLNEDISDLYVECKRHFLRAVEPSGFGTVRPFVTSTDQFIDDRVRAFLQISALEEGTGNG